MNKLTKGDVDRANRIANACTAIEAVLDMLDYEHVEQLTVMDMMLGHLLIHIGDDRTIDKLVAAIATNARRFYEENKHNAHYDKSKERAAKH